MAKRASLYLTDQVLAVIGEDPKPSLSGRINSMILRYSRITTAAMPALSLSEWAFLADILSGTLLDAEHADLDIAKYLWAEVADADPAAAAKWQVDQAALTQRLRALDYPALCAIMEVIARIQATHHAEPADLAGIVKAAGAKLKEDR
ncbi:MAG: hypothetical protein N2690_01410 [Rhodocyclaceae bacterium]|nr:hypothetical protein [Rhodocyclaceae bacterium]